MLKFNYCLFYLNLLILAGNANTLNAQRIESFKLSETCVGRQGEDCEWQISWGADGCCAITDEQGRSVLKISGAESGAVSFLEMPLAFEAFGTDRIIRFSALVKTEEVVGMGGGLNLQAYGADGALAMVKGMGPNGSKKWLNGTRDWKKVELSTLLPAGCDSVRLGAILYGTGEMYVDRVEWEIVDFRDNEPSVLARKYLRKAAKIIRKNSLYRDSVDFGKLRKTAALIAGPAEQPGDCYLGVEFMLKSLRAYGDNHSFLMPADEAKIWLDTEEADEDMPMPTVTRRGEIGYVTVPGFMGGNESLIRYFADSLRRGIASVYASDLRGWIVDLRPNTGGNMAPMVAGLAPLLDTGKLGSLVNVNGVADNWYFTNGTYWWDSGEELTLEKDVILPERLPVGVLFGPRTGSSGEAVALSFVGNTKTRTFGQKTWGLTTGNGEFTLPDGAKMFLASTRMVDRNGHFSPDGIMPQVLIEPEDAADEDAAYRAAKQWILDQ